MRRNEANQVVTAMMRTTSSNVTAIVPITTTGITSTTNTNGVAIVITASANHGLIPGNRIVISGATNSNCNGNWVVTKVSALNTFEFGDWTNGAVQNGNGGGSGGAAGTITASSVNVYVSKNGGAPATGTGTIAHIGTMGNNVAFTADKNQMRSVSATVAAAVGTTGNTNITNSGTVVGISPSTLGLWTYVPTASETDANQVTFTFTAPSVNAISVTQMFEPLSFSGNTPYAEALGGSITSLAANAINSTTLADSAATEIAAAVMASTGDTGITLTKLLEMAAAFMAGKVSVSSSGGISTYSYKKRDGSTVSFTSLCSETDGTRATTGALS